MLEQYHWRVEVDINPMPTNELDAALLQRDSRFFLVKSGHLLSSVEVVQIVLEQMKEEQYGSS